MHSSVLKLPERWRYLFLRHCNSLRLLINLINCRRISVKLRNSRLICWAANAKLAEISVSHHEQLWASISVRADGWWLARCAQLWHRSLARTRRAITIGHERRVKLKFEIKMKISKSDFACKPFKMLMTLAVHPTIKHCSIASLWLCSSLSEHLQQREKILRNPLIFQTKWNIIAFFQTEIAKKLIEKYFFFYFCSKQNK